ncbi:replication initiation factor domain-containing protein [Acinetobacter gerneri]|uniref:replication initiation factor domain-containing protein n=1 Tax=Acinetobacter gerneri TaxID=202952 RepID=UPI0012DB1913|nr:replication initiation factor domain-containing protein [Acinetobacter gerneri]
MPAKNTAVSPSETPFYNMGVADTQKSSESQAFPRHLDNYKLISTPKGVLPVLRCTPIENNIVGLDWVTFSFCVSTFGDKYAYLAPDLVDLSVGDAIETWLDQLLFEIFGFGIAQKRKCGIRFDKYGYDLQDNLGMVLYGNTNNRVRVQINGTGCALARKGWNEQLYKFLKYQAKNPKLNRVDIAFDDFESEFVSVQMCDQWDNEDQFFCGGRNPEINKLGDWKRINGKGLTFTVGNRESSKFLRCYERGKKEGDSISLWTRLELELKSSDRYLPLDVLLSPSTYFKGAYPALDSLCNKLQDFTAPEKCQLVEKQAKINVDKALEIVKTQFGKYIRQFRKFINDDVLLNLISSDKDEVPKRLNFSHVAVMQALRINQPIINTQVDESYPLFEGVSLLNQTAYKDFIHAI